MEFRLHCRMTLSKEVKPNVVGELIKSSQEILKKGDPRGKGAEIESSGFEGKDLILTIKSGTYVRPHDAVFRLKNHLARELGRTHHVGVKEIQGLEYKITFEVDSTPKTKITVPFIEDGDIQFRDSKCTIVIREKELTENFLQKNYADRIINLIREKVKLQQFGIREEHHEIIYEGENKEIKYGQNPSEELLKRKWIKRTSHRNQFIFGPQITELSEAVKRAMVDVVYKPLGFVEMMFPKLEPWSVLTKSGHLYALYQGGFNPYFFSTPKTADPKEWERISDLIKITDEVPLEEIKENLEPPKGGLSFAQCPPFWPYLEGETISSESLPIRVFDWSGPTYRYESGGAHGFERVDELHRIETLWTGTEKQVVETTKQVREKLRELIEQVLDLRMREAWVTPWFMAQGGLVDLADEKKMVVGTVDFEAYIPYDDRWLEIQNCSNNGSKYPKAFNVKGQQEELWSGCAGGSFERLLSAFLAQKGFNQDKWPKKFRKYVTDIPPELVFL